jgi:dTDP-4-amino-4,6-dideoxygalactose transaminase
MEAVAQSRTFANYGPQVIELESRLAAMLGVRVSQVVSVASCTLGLMGAISLAEVESWELPAWTFAATGHAVKAAGGLMRFVDIDPDSWMFEFDQETDRRVGKVVVLPFGAGLSSCWWDDESEVVIDAAASLGSLADSFPRIPLRTSVVFSLHATKVLGVGEGGFVVFGDTSRAQAFRSWANFGFSGSRESLSAGTNAKMSEYVAALLHCELDAWPGASEGWREARFKVESAGDRANLGVFPKLSGEISPYWIAILPDRVTRDRVADSLAVAGVETRKWWGSGLHKMIYFRQVPNSGLAITDATAGRYLGLPFFQGIRHSEVDFVVSAIAAT